MRKILMYSILCSVIILLAVPMAAQARVTGRCDNCHTMHASQNGTLVRLGNADVSGQGALTMCTECHNERRANLLKLDCMGCHAENPAAGVNLSSLGAPQVAHSGADLAAGNFIYMAFDDSYGHAVHGFGALHQRDGFLQNNPPGYNANYDPSTVKFQDLGGLPNISLMCSGSNGCHGNRDDNNGGALTGAHHANDAMLKFGASFDEAAQGATVGTSYRFLRGVRGAEAADWMNTDANNHNEYKGGNDALSRDQQLTWAEVDTISELCSECHGDFHKGGPTGVGGGSGAWVRHPTDVILPNSGEYAAYTTYDVQAPVARPASRLTAGLAGPLSDVQPGTDIVMCLSCHKAHASQYPDALRWDYANLTTGNGCFVCHTNKD